MDDRPIVSVVIPTYGAKGEGLTATCIKSMIAAHSIIQPEIVVVEDGGEQDHAEVAGLGATILKLPERSGFAKAVNAGIRRTNGEVVFLINNDIEFTEPALQIAADALMTTDSALVGIRLLYPDGRIQFGGTYFVPSKGDGVEGYFDHFGRFSEAMIPNCVTMRHRVLLTGAFLGIRRHAFNIVGLLDERFGFSAEDVDYCLQCMQAGLHTLYIGYPSAIHHEGATRGRTLEEKLAMEPEIAEKERKSLQFLFRKWRAFAWDTFDIGKFA